MADNDNSAAVKVTIEKDKLKAYVEVFPPGEGGKTYSVQEIRQILNDHGVVFGIDDNRIMEALQPQNLGYKIMVAEGNPPVDGKDGQIINKFSLSGEGGPKIDEKGNVDYFDLGLIHNVKAGELLAERIPPTEGTPGQAVTGEEIPARRGKDFKLLRGSNTVINQDETQLYAVIDGHVSIIGNKIAVNPVYKVNGNVDYSTGNIDFIGNVVISGNIVSGFKVQAGGDIEVNGFIEGAEVYANGSVIVKGGIAGGNKGKVSAGENVVAKFIENSNVESGRDILVKDAIMQSFLKAGGSVKVDGSKAIIVGGLIQATHEVESKVMGSQLATQTIIEVGVNPKLRDEYQQLIKVRAEKKKLLEKLNQNVQAFQRGGINIENLSDQKKQDLLKMLDFFKALHQEVSQMEKRIVFLEGEFQRTQSAKVRVKETVYPGVRVSIGQSIYIVNDAIKYCEFILSNGEVRMTSLR